MSSQAQLRMDGGKPFSTVHGDRPPGDPHQHVHYYQDGLPFSASRVLLADMIAGDERLVALAAKKLSRQKKQIATVIPDDDGASPQDIPDDEDDEDDDDGDINIEMWLTGEAKYIFAKIRAVVADRYKKRVNSIQDAVMFLAGEQQIVPVERLCPAFKEIMA